MSDVAARFPHERGESLQQFRDGPITTWERCRRAEARVDELEEAIASAMTSLTSADGPIKDEYAYRVLHEVVTKGKDAT